MNVSVLTLLMALVYCSGQMCLHYQYGKEQKKCEGNFWLPGISPSRRVVKGLSGPLSRHLLTRHYLIWQPRSKFSCSFDFARQTSRILKFRRVIGRLSKVLYARNRVNRSDKATPFNLKRRTMGRKKRFCKKHGMSHFPPTGKKCPGPEFSEISLSGEVKEYTGQQGGIDVDVDLLQGSIPSIP